MAGYDASLVVCPSTPFDTKLLIRRFLPDCKLGTLHSWYKLSKSFLHNVNMVTFVLMEIQQEDNGRNGMFYVSNEGGIQAEMDYTWKGAHLMVIIHTEVDDSLAGKGIGKQLVHKAVAYAREKDVKILPVCSFAKAVFERMAEYQDVLMK